MEAKVSVLIPVYNVEKFIERCARSLFSQTMKEGIEFIFTDDASEDRSMEILKGVIEDYPERRHQILLLHHPRNLGLAAARKTGFRASSGDYVIHCDSDDWVEPEMYGMMHAEAERVDADLVGCDFIYETGQGPMVKHESFDLSPRDQLKALLRGGNNLPLEVTVWNRMIKRNLYNCFGLQTPDVNKCEDIPLSVAAHCFAKRIGYVNRAFYHYNTQNPTSITNGLRHTFHPDEEAVGNFILKLVKENFDGDREVMVSLYSRLHAIKRRLLRESACFDPDKFRSLWPEIPIESQAPVKTKILYWLASNKFDRVLKFLTRIEKV